MSRLLSIVLFVTTALHAEDVLFLNNGEKRSGQLIGMDEKSFRLRVSLPPAPGSPPGAASPFASTSIPRTSVEHIEFAPDPALQALLKNPTASQLAGIEARWEKVNSWLAVPRSSAARVGNALGDLWIRSGDPVRAVQALELFRKIEKEAWNDSDKMTAKQGRLRAMVATGQVKEAVQEAIELAKASEDPAVLIEAKYILAAADDKALRKLLEDNPRWEEDIHVIPERHRLYNEVLDLYLYPTLFAGTDAEASARGLWGAADIYRLTGETQNALECARDIVALYSGTKYTTLAKDFIASLPEEQRALDPEKTAREEQIATLQESPEKPSEEIPEKPSHEKKPKKKK